MLVAAFGILYVSFARAGLDEVTNNEKYDRLRKIRISYQEAKTGGTRCYRLPESKTLPNNSSYFLKKIRDELWIKFSKNPGDELRIITLVADKKVYESILLYEVGETDLGKENMKEAENKINLAKELVNQSPEKNLEMEVLRKKVDEAEDFHNYIQKQMELGNKIVRCNE